ncbi:MAG TPA: TonB-dependent receptor, partial [Anaerolineales bacterium]
WGFNAFDGIINIITKSPEEIKGTTIQVGGGEYGTLTASAINAGKVKDFGYRLSIGHNQNAEWNDRNALAFRDNLFNILTEYALPSEAKLKVAGGLVDSNHFDGQFSEETLSSSRPAQGYANVGYERPNFFIRAFWNYYSDQPNTRFTGLLAPFLGPITYRGRESIATFAANTYNVEAQHTIQLWPGHLFVYGANYRYNTLSSTFLNNFTTENRLGLYIQDEYQVSNSVTLVAGARYDLDTFINPTVSPRIALLYRPAPNHTFRLSWSVAYRPPTMVETNSITNVNTVFSPVQITAAGNPNLAPEEINSYEASYQGWYLNHRLQVRASVFYNHLSDLIKDTDVSPTFATRVNDPGSADIYGGETGIDFLATKWLSGFANVSYQEISQTFTGRAQRGAPRFKWNAGLRGEWDNGLSGEVAYHYYGAATYAQGDAFTSFAQAGLIPSLDPRVGSYNLLNLRGGYKFWKQRASAGYLREAEVAISAFNALNDKHQEHPLGETIGSRVMGWLTVRF